DIYDPVNMGLAQDFESVVGAAEKPSIIKVEKPGKARVFRVHSDPTFRVKTMLLVNKDDNELFYVAPCMRKTLKNDLLSADYTLFACITKAGTPFLWPIKMADKSGKWNVWHQSAWQIAEKAQSRWCRMMADQEAGHYIAEYDRRPLEQQQEPEWPDMSFRDWLAIPVGNCPIASPDPPFLRRLRADASTVPRLPLP